MFKEIEEGVSLIESDPAVQFEIILDSLIAEMSLVLAQTVEFFDETLTFWFRSNALALWKVVLEAACELIRTETADITMGIHPYPNHPYYPNHLCNDNYSVA